MSNLISGKDAKKAWADGEEIEIIFDDGSHGSLLGSLPLDIFENVSVKFKLKPQTITINGIEVPKPFKPNVGDVVWCISDDHVSGYCSYKWRQGYSVVFGAWRTEEEVKQVVEALRSVLNG